MNPETETAADATQPAPGSPAWFAMLFSPPEQRPAIAAVHALWHELDTLPRRITEPEPMRMRLAWWHEELGRLEAGSPRHPRAIAASPWLEGDALATTLMRELLVAAEDEFDGRGCEHDDELRLQAFRRRGAPLGALALACGAPESIAIRDGRDTGQLMRCAEILAALGPNLARGRLELPLASLERPETLLTDDGTMPRPEQVAHGVDAVSALGQAGAAVPTRTDAPVFLRLLATLYSALLARATDVLATQVPAKPARLTAWQPLWLSWRTARAISRENTS